MLFQNIPIITGFAALVAAYGTFYSTHTFGFDLNDAEQQIMEDTFDIGEDDGVSMALLGMLAQESYFGRYGPIGDTHLPPLQRSYGPFQIRLQAARQAMSVCPEIRNPDLQWEEEIVHELMYNQQWNMEIAHCYLTYHLERANGNIDRAISAYNAGFYTFKDTNSHEYVQLVKSHAITIQEEFELNVEDDLLFQQQEITIQAGDTIYQLIREHTDLTSHDEIMDFAQGLSLDYPEAFRDGNINHIVVGESLEF